MQLDAQEDILRRRMQGVEAVELEAYRAATPVLDKREFGWLLHSLFASMSCYTLFSLCIDCLAYLYDGSTL